MKYNDAMIQEDMEGMKRQIGDYSQLKDKTVLVTGASGMLATYLVYFLMYLNDTEDYHIQVLALVRNEKKAWSKFEAFAHHKNFSLMVQDVCEPIAYDGDIDYIFHMAGNASPEFIISDPVGIIKANTVGTMNMMELARSANTKRMIYSSTREVYGKNVSNKEELSESDFGVLDPTERRACYPESKRMAESILQSYYYQYGIESVILRIAHSYGPGMVIENDGRVMADFVSHIVNNQDIVLKSKGDAVRAFCYITDAVAAMLIALLHGEAGNAYNIANETQPLAIRDVADMMVHMFPERQLKLLFDIPDTMSLGYSKMGRTTLSTAKIEQLGWKPEVRLEEGIRRTVLSFQ